MRVLHVSTNFWPTTGGIEQFILDLARNTLPLGIQSRVLCLNRISRHHPTLPPVDQVDSIPIRRLPFLDLKYYKPARLPLQELRNTDLIHVHGIGALLDYTALTRPLHHRPIVVSTHGGIFHGTHLNSLKNAYFHTLSRLSLSRARAVVASSKNDLSLFRPIVPHITLIENGVDTDRFANHPSPKIPDTYLFVGRLARNKSPDLLLRAFAPLVKRRPTSQLRLVGKDWDNLSPELTSLASSLGIPANVTLLGPLPDQDLDAEYARATYFLSASRHEGFGISLIEAMAAGCIPIVNDIPPFRDLLTDSANGFLIPFADPASLLSAIDRANAAGLTSLATSARQRAADFSWKTKAHDWKRLYDHALRKETPP